ncbi:Hypothetical predicted protein [Podarcis lilfordi]|uniref:Uncharacterized protein n=1 Tax=Podarcis lilfordi TaxID=74358 RepID=A0AA35KD34_9SAUR|nr:Hypothetical predicted protein [Podarcis lilfordi]
MSPVLWFTQFQLQQLVTLFSEEVAKVPPCYHLHLNLNQRAVISQPDVSAKEVLFEFKESEPRNFCFKYQNGTSA